MTLRVRWLGRVAYSEAHALQRAFFGRSSDDYLLLLEHPHVYTLGRNADPTHVLVPPASVGADVVETDRGGDVTYHGPGQLVGYPIVTLPAWRGGASWTVGADVVAWVRAVEDVLLAAVARFGIDAHRDPDFTGVWVGDHKLAAIGVKVTRGRAMHGFALNVDPDLTMFDHIVPCGIRGRGVTSMARVLAGPVDTRAVADAVAEEFATRLGTGLERQDVAWRERPEDLSAFSRGHAGSCGRAAPSEVSGTPVRLLSRLEAAGVKANGDADFHRPPWMKVRANLGPEYRAVKRLMRGLDLHTVCEEAGCPNIYECWADGTATFMILGERCTRACGFCLVDTRKPLPLDDAEPGRVADAVARLGLDHAVITSVARDDVPDGGARIFADTIRAVRARNPRTAVEVLIPDCKGDPDALSVVFDARPDVLNHNLETVARLQRAARPSAGYARSLGVLARAKEAGLTTKSSVILGMGETEPELFGAIADLRGVGVDILTLGQYLRPSAAHLPVVRWWTPDEFSSLRRHAEGLGFAHVEAGPLVRSSYHAKAASRAATQPSAAANAS